MPPFAQFIPDSTPEFGADPKPFVFIMVVGFVIGVLGHITKAKGLVALGVGMIFIATFVLPLGVYLSKSS